MAIHQQTDLGVMMKIASKLEFNKKADDPFHEVVQRSFRIKKSLWLALEGLLASLVYQGSEFHRGNSKKGPLIGSCQFFLFPAGKFHL